MVAPRKIYKVILFATNNMVSEGLIKTFAGILITSILAYGGLCIYSEVKSNHPNAPVYRDVNGDGITDKIIQKKVKCSSFFGDISTLEEEVLFGVKIDGKTIYMPRESIK